MGDKRTGKKKKQIRPDVKDTAVPQAPVNDKNRPTNYTKK